MRKLLVIGLPLVILAAMMGMFQQAKAQSIGGCTLTWNFDDNDLRQWAAPSDVTATNGSMTSVYQGGATWLSSVEITEALSKTGQIISTDGITVTATYTLIPPGGTAILSFRYGDFSRTECISPFPTTETLTGNLNCAAIGGQSLSSILIALGTPYETYIDDVVVSIPCENFSIPTTPVPTPDLFPTSTATRTFGLVGVPTPFPTPVNTLSYTFSITPFWHIPNYAVFISAAQTFFYFDGIQTLLTIVVGFIAPVMIGLRLLFWIIGIRSEIQYEVASPEEKKEIRDERSRRNEGFLGGRARDYYRDRL